MSWEKYLKKKEKNWRQKMSEPFLYTQKDAWSNCCSANVYDDSDICNDCKEHCAVMTKCPDCEDGEREVRDDAREFDINERWKTIKCETCNGEGEIEL